MLISKALYLFDVSALLEEQPIPMLATHDYAAYTTKETTVLQHERHQEIPSLPHNKPSRHALRPFSLSRPTQIELSKRSKRLPALHRLMHLLEYPTTYTYKNKTTPQAARSTTETRHQTQARPQTDFATPMITNNTMNSDWSEATRKDV